MHKDGSLLYSPSTRNPGFPLAWGKGFVKGSLRQVQPSQFPRHRLPNNYGFNEA